MSRDKQISEMAEVIDHTRRLARDVVGAVASSKMIATDLYEADYRKSADVAEEIFAEIEYLIWQNDTHPASELTEKIAELKKKYTGKDTNVTTNTEE